jgi:hypothetical protein
MNVWGRAALALALAVGCLGGCAPRERYAAEVGYYAEDRAVQWEVFGDYASFEDCEEEAVARYRAYESRDVAFSWACLLRDETGGFSGRFR